MAITINTVYQRVLALANKEQRGYITPQEFNLLANQAQMEIFEQYFDDVEKFNKIPGNMQEFSDKLSVLYEKIGEFERKEDKGWMTANMPLVADPLANYHHMQIPWDQIYKLGSLKIYTGGILSFSRGPLIIHGSTELLNTKDFELAMLSPLTSPSIDRPIVSISTRGLLVGIEKDVYITYNGATHINGSLNSYLYQKEIPYLSIDFIMRPPIVQWAYVIVNDKALYNDNISVNFELHSSEETELVYKILKLAGINLKAQQMVQVGQALEQENKKTTL